MNYATTGKRSALAWLLMAALFASASSVASAQAVVIYVDAGAPPGGAGTAWGNEYNDLQVALAAAAAGQGTEIWVKAGTYKPSVPAGRDATFTLVAGVAHYGGFAGGEGAVSDRDVSANPTILSGDLGLEGDSSDNSYHVVTGGDNASIDGFTVTGGNDQTN